MAPEQQQDTDDDDAIRVKVTSKDKVLSTMDELKLSSEWKLMKAVRSEGNRNELN